MSQDIDDLDVADLRHLIVEKLCYAWDFYYPKLEGKGSERIARLFTRNSFMFWMYLVQTILFVCAFVWLGWIPFALSFAVGAMMGVIHFRYKKAVRKCLLACIEYAYVHSDVSISEKLAKHELIKAKRYPRWLK